VKLRHGGESLSELTKQVQNVMKKLKEIASPRKSSCVPDTAPQGSKMDVPTSQVLSTTGPPGGGGMQFLSVEADPPPPPPPSQATAQQYQGVKWDIDNVSDQVSHMRILFFNFSSHNITLLN